MTSNSSQYCSWGCSLVDQLNRVKKIKMSLFLVSLFSILTCFSSILGTFRENLECEVNKCLINIHIILSTFPKYPLHFLFCFAQVGHKYLFSDEKRPWQDAKLECELYGGFLLYLKDINEQNCLMRHAQSKNLNRWY